MILIALAFVGGALVYHLTAGYWILQRACLHPNLARAKARAVVLGI